MFCYTCFFWVKTKSKKKLTNFWMMKIHWYLAWDTLILHLDIWRCVESLCWKDLLFQSRDNKPVVETKAFVVVVSKNSSFCALVPWFLCAWIEAWHFSGMDWQNENMMWKYTGGIWKNYLGWNVANFYSRHVPKILQVVNNHFQFYCINIRESQKPLK